MHSGTCLHALYGRGGAGHHKLHVIGRHRQRHEAGLDGGDGEGQEEVERSLAVRGGIELQGWAGVQLGAVAPGEGRHGSGLGQPARRSRVPAVAAKTCSLGAARCGGRTREPRRGRRRQQKPAGSTRSNGKRGAPGCGSCRRRRQTCPPCTGGSCLQVATSRAVHSKDRRERRPGRVIAVQFTRNCSRSTGCPLSCHLPCPAHSPAWPTLQVDARHVLVPQVHQLVSQAAARGGAARVGLAVAEAAAGGGRGGRRVGGRSVRAAERRQPRGSLACQPGWLPATQGASRPKLQFTTCCSTWQRCADRGQPGREAGGPTSQALLAQTQPTGHPDPPRPGGREAHE